jgi:excisionase family DNA binding protein
LTEDDAAKVLGIAANTLRHWRSHRYGPPFAKLGRHVRYLRSDLDAWVRSQRTGSALVADGRAR